MLLAIDVGNTQTVLGLFEKGTAEPVQVWRVDTADAAARQQIFLRPAPYRFGEPVVSPSLTSELTCCASGSRSNSTKGSGEIVACAAAPIEQAVVACVVPALTEHWVTFAHECGADEVLVVDATSVRDVLPIAIDAPDEVGADRLANALAARTCYGTPALVVDFGTATNIDVVDTAGAYVGGVISPGLEASARALFAHAARLAEVALVAPPHTVGNSTVTAVQSGLMFGEAAKVDGLIARIRDEIGVAETPVIATGGLAPRLAELCESIDHVDETLTLRGLALIAEHTK
ncbi:MAG: type III pantothenate kinase [Coriobacteriia bacterium]|nr:type III pantothenate kinase [Coriobacteriia bacterium]